MRNGIAQVRQQLFVAEGIASEYTAISFITGASPLEVALLNETGTANPTPQETFFVAYKDVDGTYIRSYWIEPANVRSVNITTATTAVPAYSSFPVTVSGLAAGDLLESLVNVYGYMTGALADRQSTSSGVVFATGDISAALAAKLGVQMCRNLSYAYENYPTQTVYNKAGYAAVFETEADVVVAKGDLTNTNLIWVIANGAPYTVADKTALTFGTICTLKTNWASEISGGTAVYVPNSRHFNVVQKLDTISSLYVICKTLVQDDERKLGTTAPVEVGARWLDYSNGYAATDITVTDVAEKINPGCGKQIRNMEVSLDKLHRPAGRFEKLGETPVLGSVKTKTYHVVSISYYIGDYGTHTLGVDDANWHTLMIAFDDTTDATNFKASLDSLVNDIKDHNLEDHLNVSLTDIADDEILKVDVAVDGSLTWENAADEVGT